MNMTEEMEDKDTVGERFKTLISKQFVCGNHRELRQIMLESDTKPGPGR